MNYHININDSLIITDAQVLSKSSVRLCMWTVTMVTVKDSEEKSGKNKQTKLQLGHLVEFLI